MVNWPVHLVDVKLNNEKNKNNDEGDGRKLSPSDFYIEDGKYVFTEEFHLKRGFCCNSICRHCCFLPIHIKGTTSLQSQYDELKNKIEKR